MTFDDIAAGYYQALTAGLGLSGAGIQLVPPSVIPSDDATLWTFLDQIPPTSLYRDNAETGTFFASYERILASCQIPTRNRFRDAVGENIADEFVRFLAKRPGDPVPPTRYPAMFRGWALLHHSAVAIPGTTALSGMLLEPLGAAAVALLGYQDATTSPPRPGRPPDWDESYDDLTDTLSASPSRTFSLATDTLVTDITSTWTHGRLGGPPGLWGSDTPTSSQAEAFASSEFTLAMALGHVMLFRPVPGPWFSAAALDIAYVNPDSPPWASGSALDWDQAFGATGLLRTLATGLVVADSVQVAVTSRGPYNPDDQRIILDHVPDGLWPLHLTASTDTTCSFTRDGALEIQLATAPGVPVLLGVATTSIQRYLGHG